VSLDEARLLPRARSVSAVERFELERLQGAALVDGLDLRPDAVLPVVRPRLVAKDPQDLRGIPVVGMGIGGVSPGSKPGSDASLERLDRERERRAA
jgi:hypothetical protein